MVAQYGGSDDRLRAAAQAAPRDGAQGETAQGETAQGETAPGETAPAEGAPAEGTAGGPDDRTPQEISVARKIRAQRLVSGRPTAEIAAVIHDKCGPAFGTTWIRAYRLALGITLADVVAQVRARYDAEGRTPPRFSETMLSAYESAQKRPGPEYLHYVCAVYQAEPRDLGYQDPCFCGNRHRSPAVAGLPAPARSGSADIGVAGGEGTQGAAARRLPAARPVPAPRDGTGATWVGVPQGGAAASVGAEVTPVALVLAPGESAGQDYEGETDDDVLRRALLRLMAGAGTAIDGRFFGVVDRIRRRMDEALLGASVSATMLDQWEETADGYGRQYLSVPPLRLLCDILLDLGDVRRMCEQRQPLESVERLRRLAAKLAALSGMTMINIGDQRLARSFFRTARMAADETGDRHLRGWVAVRESMVPLYYGDPGEAALVARAGGDLAGRSPCVAGVMAPVLEARGLARLASGGYSGVREMLGRANAALERAQQVLGGLPGDVRSDTAFGYSERQLLFHQGDTLVTLGDHKGAEDAFRQSLRMYSRAEILDRSLIALGQARCRLEAGEPEEALRLSRDTVFALPQQHRSGLVVRAARSLGESVGTKHGDLPALREYREALRSG